MSFRLKLFLSIAVAVLLTSLIEGTLDYVYEGRQAQLERQTHATLNLFADAAVSALDLTTSPPLIHSAIMEELPRLRGERLRVLQEEMVMLSYGGLFPAEPYGWARHERYLGHGYRLEVAMPLDVSERILGSELLRNLLDLPLFFALAFGVAWLLTRLVMRPVGELTRALQQLSHQHFPEPVTVPPGDDELSNMARSFNLMSASIKSLLERERSFTRYASHELRTPLSALKLQVEALEMGLSDPNKALPIMERNIRRMEGVLTALLSLARSSEHDPSPVRLLSLVSDTLASFPEETAQRITILDWVRYPLQVTDASLVGQALRNLLENALKYSPGAVTLIIEQRGMVVRLRVCDRGSGVPEEVIGEITKPFFRLHTHSEGLGLGLALVENIARSTRGSFELKNTPTGLEATLSVPVYKSSSFVN